MTELMRRRRALMSAAKSQGGAPDYELSNYTVTAGEMIDTGFHPFVDGGAFTVLFDMTTTANPTSGTAANWVFLYCAPNENATYVGKGSKWVTTIRASWLIGSPQPGEGSTSKSGRHRLAVTHLSNGQSLIVKGRDNDGTVYQMTGTSGKAYVDDTNDTLIIGGPTEEAKGLPPGTIHSVKAYSRVLSDDEINAFLA